MRKSSSASRLVRLPNGTVISTSTVRNLLPITGKGVVLKNEYNKLVAYLEIKDASKQRLFIDTMFPILDLDNSNWEQPNWVELGLAD